MDDKMKLLKMENTKTGNEIIISVEELKNSKEWQQDISSVIEEYGLNTKDVDMKMYLDKAGDAIPSYYDAIYKSFFEKLPSNWNHHSYVLDEPVFKIVEEIPLHEYYGQIEYLGSKGTVIETSYCIDKSSFDNEANESYECGRPITATVFEKEPTHIKERIEKAEIKADLHNAEREPRSNNHQTKEER